MDGETRQTLVYQRDARAAMREGVLPPKVRTDYAAMSARALTRLANLGCRPAMRELRRREG